MRKDKITCVILDDEPFAVNLINDYADKTPELDCIYAGSDLYHAINVVKESEVDIIFLDIEMPELSGVDIMRMLNRDHYFVIISAYPEYALESYDFNVIDYLLKPVTYDRFYQCVRKVEQWILESRKTGASKDHIFVKSNRKYYKVLFQNIIYIEGMKDYIRIHTETEKILVHENMKDIIKKLPEEKFMRIHRSYIISIDHIKLIEGNAIQLEDKSYIPVGDTYRKIVGEWVAKL